MLPSATQSDRARVRGREALCGAVEQDIRVTQLHEKVKTKRRAADRLIMARGKLCLFWHSRLSQDVRRNRSMGRRERG